MAWVSARVVLSLFISRFLCGAVRPEDAAEVSVSSKHFQDIHASSFVALDNASQPHEKQRSVISVHNSSDSDALMDQAAGVELLKAGEAEMAEISAAMHAWREMSDDMQQRLDDIRAEQMSLNDSNGHNLQPGTPAGEGDKFERLQKQVARMQAMMAQLKKMKAERDALKLKTESARAMYEKLQVMVGKHPPPRNLPQ
eukprot:CAMPEP_0169341538 /NCGR_PEP_ID=MMETSP1017-20121227/19537_1 /TAXON_ID=342587 /ORGANISM="Karlodinium micrum, Strain CCMP2283" /LENGTH=197 /DNA_ID=CAMNT_0009437215 /DNA_START=36 /DNA_END=629 /DNA_ORIENTATION=-